MTVPAALPPAPAVHVVARPSPFRSDVARLVAPPGLTVAELAEQALTDPIARNLAQATLVGPDGSEWPLPRERWHVVRPRAGIELRLVVVPRGGSFRGIVRIALTIAIVVAAAALTVGNTTYLRCLFDFGYGPLELSDIRIGTTPITQFEGVETEILQGWPGEDSSVGLYPSAIRQDSFSLKVSAAGGPQVIESRDNTVEIGIDLTFNGIFRVDRGDGNTYPTSAGVRLEYRRVGEPAWSPWADDVITPAPTTGTYSESFRKAVGTPGRYEVRITRTTPDTETSQEVRSTFFVTALRSFQPGRPVLAKGRCLLGLRIRATDQLNGTIQDLSAISEALLPVWNGSGWAYQKTRTPAWAYLDVLRGQANRFPVGDDRIQLSDFLAWAARTDAVQPDGGPKQTFDGVIDTRSTVFQTLRDIAAAGRAAPAMRDGKFSVVEDVPQTVPIQHFTPRNSWAFVGAKVFSESWHGVRVRYVDPDRDWQPGARVLLRHTIEGEGAEIAYRVAPPMWGSGSDPMWSSDADPMFGTSRADWLPWPGALVDPPGGLELHVRIAGGQDRGAIRRLQAALDAPRIDEAFADIAIDVGGTRLPIEKPYRGIGAVTVTLQGGTAALSAQIIDKNTTLGPLVQCFDSTGTGVAATVDALITGY